jgi:formate-dependent nitrite reductase membrane component NrfD
MIHKDKSFFAADDFVTDYRVQTGWGFPIALYFFFSGTGASLFLFSLIVHSSPAVLLDLLFLGIGVIILFFDLGNPWRFWKAFAKPGSSWISRGTFLITILFLFDLIYALVGYPPLPGLGSILLGAVAVLVLLYPGLVISYSPSIPSWNHSFIPILFGLHSVTNGLALGLLISPYLEDQWNGVIPFFLGLLLLLLVGTGVFLLVSYASTSGSRESIRLFVRGRLGSLSLILGTGLGIIMPMILLIGLSEGLLSWPVIPIICAMRLIGDIGFRYAILKVGLYEPLI